MQRPSRRLLLFSLALIVIASCFSLPRSYASEASWEDSGGPGSGDVLSLQWDAGRNVLYAQFTGRGIWKYQDSLWLDLGLDARNTSGLSDHRPFVFDSTHNLIFAPSDRGIMRCDHPEASPTWNDLGWSDPGLYPLVYDPVENVLYAAFQPESAWPFGGQIWRCNNPDTDPTWTDTNSPANSYFDDLKIDTIHNVLYAFTAQGGLWRCDNPSATPSWQDMGGHGIQRFICSPDIDRLWAIVYDPDVPSYTIWRCDDPRTSPAWLSTGGPLGETSDIYSLCYDPVQKGLYTVAAGKAWRCDNPTSAPAWTDTGLLLPAGCYGSVMMADSTGENLFLDVYDPAGSGPSGVVWQCTSPATAPVWRKLSGMDYDSHSMYMDESRKILIDGTTHGVWECQSLDSTPTWSQIGGASNYDVTNMALDTTHSALYASTTRFGFWRLTSGDPNWTGMTQTTDWASGVLACDNPRNILYAERNGHVQRCRNPNTSIAWEDLGAIGGQLHVCNLFVDSTRNLLYAATDHGLWRCEHPDTSPVWTDLGGISSYSAGSIAYDAGRNIFYVGCSEDVYDTTTGGRGVWVCRNPDAVPAWSHLGWGNEVAVGNLVYESKHDVLYACISNRLAQTTGLWRCDNPDGLAVWQDLGWSTQTDCLAYDEIHDMLYLGTKLHGVWRCEMPYATARFSPLGGMLENWWIRSLSYNEASDTLYAGTWSQGVWQTSKPASAAQVITGYLAEGYTGPGFHEYLCFANQGLSDASVRMVFSFSAGTSTDQLVTVAPGSRLTADINAIVGDGKEVSITLQSSQPLYCERPMYFTYGGRTGGHVAAPASSPAHTWYFAEGYTGPGFDEYVCVFNPSQTDTTLDFLFQTKEGAVAREGYTVPARSRRTFRVNDLLGSGYETSLTLQASQPVIAERALYFGYGLWSGGSCVMGATSLSNEYCFAEGTTRNGFTEYLTLQNPGEAPIRIDATYQLGESQGSPVNKSYTVEANSRTTVYVPDEVGSEKDVSVRLTSTASFLAERPMYFDYTGYGADWTGGHCVIGASAPASEWFFAEGCTLPGFHEYLCLQNPGDTDATVEITYLTQEAGALPVQTAVVPAHSRITSLVNVAAGEGYQLSCRVRVVSGPAIVAERPMYFDYNGWDGGHDALGVVP